MIGFGPFKATLPRLGGLLWKVPAVMSRHQKARQRLRLKIVDRNVARLFAGLKQSGQSCSTVDKFLRHVPTEAEMPAKDKYTIFSRKSKTYRKGAHREPKWTRLTNRTFPRGF
ncbi:large ribosomal subunit protein mL60 [Trichomonascus vanleenenianus]|uniref:mitochondrial 54S ribosomal protein mL60 MRPL31 n=1 Tax=Trichomonascus vanleenenianus TaxID=2268995 RepID=UPI003ECB7702